MRSFKQEHGIVVALARDNIDTDAILPKQYLKLISRSGFGQYLFDDWRYLPDRSVNPEFILNEERYAAAKFLLAGDNFGCGSSREHAVWALTDYGFRAVLATSFADIFYNNCFKNGLLPVIIDHNTADYLFARCASENIAELTIDLTQQCINDGNREWHFKLDDFRRHALLNGLDDIGQTLRFKEEIQAFETAHRRRFPWLFTVYEENNNG